MVDPGSGMDKNRIRDKHPGSATLIYNMSFAQQVVHLAACAPVNVGTVTYNKANTVNRKKYFMCT